MSWAVTPFTIETPFVRIAPLEEFDLSTVAEAIYDPESIYSTHWNIVTVPEITDMLKRIIQGRERKICNPFVFTVNGEVAGTSRFLAIDDANKNLEIGGTWIAPKFRSTFVNTHVKYELLRYAFEEIEAARVELKVNQNNYRSQMAVLRIGGRFEGCKINRYSYPNNENGNAHFYGFSRQDWPEIQVHFSKLKNGQPADSLKIPRQFTTERLRLCLYKLSDADSFAELVKKNRADLADSFPVCSRIETSPMARKFIAEKNHSAHAGQSFFFALFRQEQQIGQLQIKNLDWTHHSAEIGYFLTSEMRQQGYMTEAIQQTLNILRARKFRRVYARILPENTASQRLMTGLGFSLEGTQKMSFKKADHEMSDLLIFSKILAPN